MMLEDRNLHESSVQFGAKSSAGVWIILTYSEYENTDFYSQWKVSPARSPKMVALMSWKRKKVDGNWKNKGLLSNHGCDAEDKVD